MINTEQLRPMIGKGVEMLYFTQFAVHIHLQDRIGLMVEADFEHIHGETHKSHLMTFPASESSLMRILESSVVSATVNASGDLSLVFSNGDHLKIPKRPEFESYRFKVGSEELFA